MAAPAAADPPVLQQRLRPLIYVYDLPAEFNSKLLQVQHPAAHSPTSQRNKMQRTVRENFLGTLCWWP